MLTAVPVSLQSIIFDEVDLTDASVAESSTKNVNNSFTVITPCRKLILCADNRKEMEDWIAALKTVQNREHFEVKKKNSPSCPLLNILPSESLLRVDRMLWNSLSQHVPCKLRLPIGPQQHLLSQE